MGIIISDYNRNGVFIEERNHSVIDRPTAQEATVNFIPGFSRKGTVFNRPVLIRTRTDRANFFGEIDRFLEKKGSYFHRTIDIATQSGPVWAMNLLKTNSLDQLNYASVSVSAQYDNAPIKYRQYDEFFNKSGFWQKDTESFLFFAKDSQRMLHLTNFSDKKISVFMFKSTMPGYDITAEEWYGGKDKVPTWMSQFDFISDYMVRVVVVSGDWTNYVQLAADPKWSRFFDASGLRKTQVNNFINDRGVSLLGDYNGSLIPFFRDAKNNDIFIENMINLNSDRTGLFASFDIDTVETDFPNGNIDVIGQTLVDQDKNKINFMSYQDTIEEVDLYSERALDRFGNVIGIGSINGRTAIDSNGTLSGLTIALVGDDSAAPELVINSISGKAIINNNVITIPETNLTLSSIAIPDSGSTYRIDAVYINQSGQIIVAAGTTFNGTSWMTENQAVIAGLTYPASMPNNAIVLGYILRIVTNDGVFVNTYEPVALSNTGFVPLTIGTTGTDIIVDTTFTNTLEMVFTGTANVTKANYKAWRRVLFFNELVTKKILSNSVIIDDNGNKVDLSSAMWTDNYSSGSGDKYINLTVGVGIDIASSPASGDFVFYFNDDEFVIGTAGLETRNGATGIANHGIVAEHSSIYKDYYNGRINTGDYFFVKAAETTSLKFVHYTNLDNPASVGSYIVMSAADATALGLSVGTNNFHALIKGHPVNNGDYLLTTGEDSAGMTFAPGLVADGFLTGTEIAFKVNNLVANYATTMNLNVYDYNQKVYLKMYLIGATLMIKFMADNTLTTPYTIPGPLLGINRTIAVYSGEASYTQTLEIEQHQTYIMTDTKFLIDMVRYPEVKVGDYVKAYFDPAELNMGEYPKKFARIMKKTPWSGNSTHNVQYAEITTDVKIDVMTFANGTDLQTTRYTTIEDYVDTYKAIQLNGFTVQSSSVPDGFEERQVEILDIIGKNTPLFNAIVNKNKFNFRYLVDSFGNGLTPFSKQQLVDIAGKRKNCLAFINMPSVKQLKNSSNPSFINVDGTLNLEYLKLGGNLQTNPAFLYSLATGSGKDDGRDASAYFFPYVKVNDNGRPMIFPPAVFAMNAYMRKINSNVAGVYSWTITAGVEHLIQGISDVEQDFTEDDLVQMYAMGINPIMYAKNRGFYLENEFTASTQPLSALSFIHVRELLIDLENEIYAMLFKYQHKFNTPAIRAKIKREADEICQKYVDRSGLYAYENVIDESNNTPTLIDNQFGLLDTYIEPVKGMGIIVNTINVMATGALGSSDGFGMK
jgi:hypothetical protein